MATDIPLAELFMKHLVFLKTKMFYFTVTVLGFFTGLTLLSAVGESNNPYYVYTWAFWVIAASLSFVLGFTLWLAQETKHVVKNTLPAIPKNVTPDDLTKIQNELNSNKTHQKFQRLSLARSIFMYTGLICGFLLAQDMLTSTLNLTNLTPTWFLIAQATIAVGLIVVGTTIHIILLSQQKRNLQTATQTTVVTVQEATDDQPQQ